MWSLYHQMRFCRQIGWIPRPEGSNQENLKCGKWQRIAKLFLTRFWWLEQGSAKGRSWQLKLAAEAGSWKHQKEQSVVWQGIRSNCAKGVCIWPCWRWDSNCRKCKNLGTNSRNTNFHNFLKEWDYNFHVNFRYVIFDKCSVGANAIPRRFFLGQRAVDVRAAEASADHRPRPQEPRPGGWDQWRRGEE